MLTFSEGFVGMFVERDSCIFKGMMVGVRWAWYLGSTEYI